MRLLRLFSSVLILSFAFIGVVSGQFVERSDEAITGTQPLAVGTIFFTKSTPKAGYQVHYTYMGFEGGNIKVKYELYYHYDQLESADTFSLPINGSKQAVLNTRPLYGETLANTTKLLITVVDDFGRINVQKYK